MRSFLSLFTRLPRALVYALRGVRAAAADEPSFQLQLITFAIFAPLAVYLGDDGAERAALIIPLFIILIVELINSAIEAAVDRIGPEIHPLSRRAKDLASAAALLSVALATTVWALILYPKTQALFSASA